MKSYINKMIVRTIEQALYTDLKLNARSDGFDEAWQEELERVIAGYGLPTGITALPTLFTRPFADHKQLIASVRGRDFHLLILDRDCYDVIPDPFIIAERFPPDWNAHNTLPTLEWPDEPLPKRTTEQLNEILKNGDGPFLLGGCQALVDSSRILLIREQPATELLRALWMLIPDSIRRQTTFATFAYSNELGFGLVVLPQPPNESPYGYLTEDQARDYPESRYERELQISVEMNDQRSLDKLLARKSSTEVLRFAVVLLFVFGGLSLLARIMMAP
jgi:hypothetical protein